MRTVPGRDLKERERIEYMKTRVMPVMARVVPEMIKALAVEPWSPTNEQGFGCFNCHTPRVGADPS